MTTKNKPIVYESPDGGNTVWARVVGELGRYEVSKSQQKYYFERLSRWREILTLAQTDTDLNTEIERIEVLYELKNKR